METFRLAQRNIRTSLSNGINRSLIAQKTDCTSGSGTGNARRFGSRVTGPRLLLLRLYSRWVSLRTTHGEPTAPNSVVAIDRRLCAELGQRKLHTDSNQVLVPLAIRASVNTLFSA